MSNFEAFCLRCKTYRPFAESPKVREAGNRLQLVGQCVECGSKLVSFVKIHHDKAPCTVKVSGDTKATITQLAEKSGLSQREALDICVRCALADFDSEVAEYKDNRPQAEIGETDEAQSFWHRLARWLMAAV